MIQEVFRIKLPGNPIVGEGNSLVFCPTLKLCSNYYNARKT